MCWEILMDLREKLMILHQESKNSYEKWNEVMVYVFGIHQEYKRIWGKDWVYFTHGSEQKFWKQKEAEIMEEVNQFAGNPKLQKIVTIGKEISSCVSWLTWN